MSLIDWIHEIWEFHIIFINFYICAGKRIDYVKLSGEALDDDKSLQDDLDESTDVQNADVEGNVDEKGEQEAVQPARRVKRTFDEADCFSCSVSMMSNSISIGRISKQVEEEEESFHVNDEEEDADSSLDEEIVSTMRRKTNFHQKADVNSTFVQRGGCRIWLIFRLRRVFFSKFAGGASIAHIDDVLVPIGRHVCFHVVGGHLWEIRAPNSTARAQLFDNQLPIRKEAWPINASGSVCESDATVLAVAAAGLALPPSFARHNFGGHWLQQLWEFPGEQ